MGYAAAPIVIGNLFGDQINAALGMTGQMTQAEAIENIATAFEDLSTWIETATGRAQEMGDMFGGYLSPAALDAADDIQKMAERAGYTTEQIAAMTEALGTQAATVTEAANLANTLSAQLGDLAYNFSVVNEGGRAVGGSMDDLNLTLMEYADSLGLSSEATEYLKGRMGGLSDQIYANNQNIEAVTATLQNEFIAALEEMIATGEVTAETFASIRENILSIPSSLSTEVNITRTYTDILAAKHGGQIPEFHAGFLPRLHAGLGAYEMPAIIDRREAIIQAPSVTRETLPVLDHINRTGQVPATAAPVNLGVTFVTDKGERLMKKTYKDMARGGGPSPKRIRLPF
jgi:methyl-accepting chemotaxis protein